MPVTPAADAFQQYLPPGTVVRGQYRIVRLLGQPGGFGLVYLVEEEGLGSRAALKEFLPRDFARRDERGAGVTGHSTQMQEWFEHGKKRFIEEARVLARIRHANVIGVRTCFEANGTAYLLMDYHPGRTLAEELAVQKGRLDTSVAVEVMIRILDGLQAAHRQGVLHRDVKPENIYLTAEGQPILLDFGAARQAVGEKTRKLTAILTPGYAPAEQYGSETEKQGPWTDTYAAAAVLYRILVGKPPIDAMTRLSGEDLPAPADLVTSVDKPLSDAVMKGLSLRRSDRFQTPREFAQALDAEGNDSSQTEGAGQSVGASDGEGGGFLGMFKRGRSGR